MTDFRFIVDRIDPSGLIVGKNVGDSDIPVGSTFVAIGKGIAEGKGLEFRCADLGFVATIHLTLTEVQCLHATFEMVFSGYSAGLVVEGEGLDGLKSILDSAADREYVYLMATRD